MRRFRIIEGDALTGAGQIASGTAAMCVTSPPYYGLRSYGTQPQTWGGVVDCGHVWGIEGVRHKGGPQGKGGQRAGRDVSAQNEAQHANAGSFCQLCGAWRGELGQEPTPELFVEHLVQIFREVRRVLKTDGTVWLNLADSYASHDPGGPRKGEFLNPGGRPPSKQGVARNRAGTYIGSNPANSLKRVMESGTLVFGNAATVGITGKGRDVSLHDNGFPQRVLLSLLGIERVTVKQRDNNFCQVLHTLASPSYCWVAAPVAFASVNGSDLEIVVDACDDLSIVIAEHDCDAQAAFGVARVGRGRAGKNGDSALAVEQSAKPITEVIRGGETVGNPVTFNSPLESLPDIYFVDKAVALGDRLDARPCHRPDFRVAKATEQEVAFSFGNFGFQIRTAFVSHLFSPNRFGSLVRYAELYDKAIRRANAMQPKQELGIPEMVKRALMEDGWICRQTIIWHKPNPMPESVTDRCTKAHESIFLLSKSPRYYFDADAIKEPAAWERWGDQTTQKRNPGTASWLPDKPKEELSARTDRNKRSVWTVPTRPFSEAHFAVFPPDLIEPCILAGSKEGDVVYDPFTGSGTTGLVALRHGRNFIGSELNPEYAAMARRRIAGDAPLLNTEEAAA